MKSSPEQDADQARRPRPSGTNWIRIMAGEGTHLVNFVSADWKLLVREKHWMPTAERWLIAFGFGGPPGSSLAKGLEIGYEVPGKTEEMLAASRALLGEVEGFETFATLAPERRKKVRPWKNILPPLIRFLSACEKPEVILYNHHR